MSSRRGATFALFSSRFMYAANWYNLSPAVGQIGAWYGIDRSIVGLIFTAFLIGAGAFQIPAGILASRIGAKKCSVIGISLMVVSDLLPFYAPSFPVLLVFRMIGGIGAAFFFSSALAVLSDIYPENMTSMIWLYNACFNLGGGFGIIAMTGALEYSTWIGDSLLMGAMTFPFILLLQTLVPASERFPVTDLPRIREKVLDLRIWLLAIGFSGFWACSYEFPEFLKDYVSFSGSSSVVSGIIGSLALFAGLSGILIIPWIKKWEPIKASILMTALVGIGVMSLPFIGIYGIAAVTIGEGILFVLVSALEYVVVLKSEPERRYRPLRLGLFNSIQISLGSFFSLIFTLLLAYGFTFAWEFLGITVIALLPAVFLKRGSTLPQTPLHS